MTTVKSNFGPLTTRFEPPQDCFDEKWYQHDSSRQMLRWGADCNSGTVGFASSCFPPGWVGFSSNADIAWKGFYPGLGCPSGFQSAAAVTGSKSGNELVTFLTDLGEYDVATACCPSGYFFDVHGCAKLDPSFGPKTLLTTSGDKCVETTSYPYNGVHATGDTSATFRAFPVVIIQDIRSSTTFPAETTTSSSSTNSSTTSSSSDSNGGLSSGAKIAIGVCIPVVVIGIAVACFILWWRRKRARSGDEVSRPIELPGDKVGGISEIDSGASPDPVKKQELDARNEISWGATGAPAELLADLPTHTTRAELSGN
ncbi:hypothetical protein N7448_005328 [Penicillium atrosanguineum]|nr:hypothetical protein N7526_008196 [Penicillium atrosanguineum]KAJ5136774.1 hypothetical protein N7448_005328 [Penicillium atrosanguineum]